MRARIDVFKRTEDDWYPAYILKGWYKGKRNPKLVTVSLLQLRAYADNDGWRVCVWGGDDTGLERDYLNDDYYSAEELFQHIISLEFVNVDTLKSLGFQPA